MSGSNVYMPSRRSFIGALAAGVTSFALPSLAHAFGQRTLSFVHTHTGDSLTVTYFRDGMYQPAMLARVAFVLRDFRSGDVHQIDPMLLDALHDLQLLSQHDKPYQVISAFRSSTTNATLRKKSKGVAEHSMHIEGKAIDVRVSGVSTKKLRDLAISMNRGGVGYYPGSDFLHIDTGRLRSWQG
jgi:uncharacterized protein YcbK (DUF882 family)